MARGADAFVTLGYSPGAIEAALARSRRRAVLTIVHNEPVFLPIWLRFYSRFFAADDIYVLDNDTTDGSTDGDGFVRVPVSPRPDRHDLDGRDRSRSSSVDCSSATTSSCSPTWTRSSLPMPEWGNLRDYLDRLDEEFVNPLGYEILHLRDREPAARSLPPRSRPTGPLVRPRRLRQAACSRPCR